MAHLVPLPQVIKPKHIQKLKGKRIRLFTLPSEYSFKNPASVCFKNTFGSHLYDKLSDAKAFQFEIVELIY